MNKSVPSATSWPDESKTAEKLRAKRSKIVPIERKSSAVASAELVRMTRRMRNSEKILQGFIAALLYREKDGTSRVGVHCEGLSMPQAMMLQKKLERWLEE